jgi:hypothetical protein
MVESLHGVISTGKWAGPKSCRCGAPEKLFSAGLSGLFKIRSQCSSFVMLLLRKNP